MRILVHFYNPAEQAVLCRCLQTWIELSCVSMDITTGEPMDFAAPPAILFWDLDGPDLPPILPPDSPQALFLCSRDPQRAIDSYAFHPAGFLTKPVSMDRLWDALLRCAPLWFPALQRLELLNGRIKIGIPFQNLMWLEGTRRGCLVHASHHTISAREPLYQLEHRLPSAVFARCQRSFVVNLSYIREIRGTSLFLNDGTELSMGRGTKSQVLEAYRHFCRRRHGI